MEKALDESSAKLILNALKVADSNLGLALLIAQETCSTEEFEEIRAGIAATIASVQLDAARPICARYPQLDPYSLKK